VEVLYFILAVVMLLGALCRSSPEFARYWGSVGQAGGGRAAARRERRRAAAEQRRAERLSRAAERRAERIAEERLKRVEGQMSRGSAGFANQNEAREALRGRGGRSNELDERWFGR
jgi:hypothetical protein